jgi:hypothetical protein
METSMLRASKVALILLISCDHSEEPTSQVVSTPSSPIIVFDTSACSVDPPDTWWRCVPRQKSIELDRPAATALGLVKAMPFIAKLTYDFTCRSSEPLEAFMTVAGNSIRIGQSPTSQPLTTPEFAVPFSGATVNFDVRTPAQSTFVFAGCSLKVLSYTVHPSVDALESYAEHVISEYEDRRDLYTSAARQSTLPGKWQAVVESPDRLMTMANVRMGQCRRFARDLRTLMQIDPDARSDKDLARIRELSGAHESDQLVIDPQDLCPSFPREVVEIAPSFCAGTGSVEPTALGGQIGKAIDEARSSVCLAADIKAGIPASFPCDSASAETACLSAVRAIEDKLRPSLDRAGREAFELASFLERESSRLASEALDAHAAFDAIRADLSSLQTP